MNFTRTPRLLWAAVIVLLLIALGIYLRSGSGARPQPEQVRPALTVTLATPKREMWPNTITASGVIAPWQEASIGTQIGSYQLIEVRVNIGDRVRRGQVLARLNPALLLAEEAQLRARSEQADANHRRATALHASGAISEQELLAAATEAKAAAALLAAKRLELRYTYVRAPDDGVITARTATLGAVMPAGQELFRMIRQNRLEWHGELTAPQLAGIVAGQRVALKLPDGGGASAIVRQTAPAMDAQSRLAIVYADITPGGSARAGMYVTGDIAIGESSALTVPAECVVVRDGRSHVVVAEPGATPKVTLRVVTPGRRRGNAIEIRSGLTGGERLVLRGAAFLGEGDIVRIARAP